jgi:NAD(P)-dependent dehydrogenase (short-subunit alcohol dehydrogenase family)
LSALLQVDSQHLSSWAPELILRTGIGKATALQYAADNCQRIAIADIRIDSLRMVQSELEQKHPTAQVHAIQVDVSSLNSVQAMVGEAVQVFGRLDYCANVAGILRFGDSVSLPADTFEQVYQVNLRGIFYCVKEQVAQMITQEPLTSR